MNKNRACDLEVGVVQSPHSLWRIHTGYNERGKEGGKQEIQEIMKEVGSQMIASPPIVK